MEERKCTKCGAVLPISEFTLNKNSRDGYSRICKHCLSNSKKIGNLKRGYNVVVTADPERPLAKYTPRQLMQELRLRGYDGELTFVQKIKLSTV